jgi:hydroxymethylpyrimidine pyrophosphatase-like HAD family hydrolase
MKIDALVFDLDGTAIPPQIDGLPSARVIAAVKEAKKKCHVSIASGRSLPLVTKIVDALGIDDLCILNGGASLYSGKTKEYVWQQQVDPHTLEQALFQLKKFNEFQVDDDRYQGRVSFSAYQVQGPVNLFGIFALPQSQAQEVVAIIEKLPGLVAHAMGSWTPNMFDVHITHELATKKHALQSLLARLNVDHKNVMVVGDGGNDLPLFELAGFKVAMGNGSEALKAKADWIAPTVDEDGLAVAIEKYILS